MNFTRRQIIKAAITLPWINTQLKAKDSLADLSGLMIAGCKDALGQPCVAMFRLDTLEYKLVMLKERCHDLVHHPFALNRYIVPARRPGNTLTMIDTDLGEILTSVSSAPDRHFYGHCSFTEDGKHLLTTENDFFKGKGIISIRDAETLKTIDEIDSFGIGPHDIALMPGGETAVVANGGILTHPDSGRRKLNIDEMTASLAYIDLTSFKLLGQYFLDDPKLSIRHIDVNSSGDVGIACQHQARYVSEAKDNALIGIHKNKALAPQLFALPSEITSKLNRYTADFCFAVHSNTAAITSPRGNLVVIVDTQTLLLKQTHTINEPSAVSLSRDRRYFVISTALGEIHFINAEFGTHIKALTITIPGLSWDNHMSVV